MNSANANLGPVFSASKLQPNPTKKVIDLGIVMTWGKLQHSARLYHNVREHAPKAFRFDFVSIHEDDAREDFEYQPSLARQTKLGTFYPLSAYLAKLYDDGSVNRNIFSALAELDNILPKECPVTAKDDKYCLAAAKVTAQEPAEPATGLLASDLQAQGFRVTNRMPEDGRISLEIGWLPKPSGRIFFAGILELRQTPDGVSAQWMLPGLCGVSRLLRKEFQQLCTSPKACLTPKGNKHAFAGITSIQNSAKHLDVWPTCVLT